LSTWRDRLRDARNFWEVAEAAHDPEHTNQAAGNAVLAVVAANDAVCLFLGRRKPGGQSHTEAARVLQEVCRGTKWEQDAAQRSRQLAELLRQKNAAQYGGRPFTAEEADRVMRQSERFLDWAERLLLT
jgi:HEPN domain-containing protein